MIKVKYRNLLVYMWRSKDQTIKNFYFGDNKIKDVCLCNKVIMKLKETIMIGKGKKK